MNLNSDNQLLLNKSVQLKPYISRELISYEIMSDQELIDGAGGTLVLDTECYPNYFLLVLKNIYLQKFIIFELPINKDKLIWILRNYTTVGFNSIKYDLPMIWLAASGASHSTLKEASDALVFEGLRQGDFQKRFGCFIFRTSHVDLIEVCPLKGSLKLYAARLHAKRIQDLPIDINKNLNDEEIRIVKDYCVNDIDSTEVLLNNLNEQLKLRYDLSKQYGHDLMSKSDAQIAEAVINTELKKLTGQWPKRPEAQPGTIYFYKPPKFISFKTQMMRNILEKVKTTQYQVLENGRIVVPKELENLCINIGDSVFRMGNGGLHSSEHNISYCSNEDYSIIDRDVASYYPAILLNCGFYPQHLGQDFLKVYKSIVDRRLQAKKLKQSAIADGLKITANGTFGKLGSPYSILYAPDLMIQVTVTGQLALLMLIEEIELNGIKVISANTDGIVVYCGYNQRERLNQIFKNWENITGFVTEETEYKSYFSRDVNAYLALKNDGEIKGKNLFYDPWNGSNKDAIWRFHKNPNCQICTEAVQNLIAKNIPIEETIKNCKDFIKFVAVKNVKGGAHKNGYYLGKVVRWVYMKNETGTINYILNNNKVPDTEGARPMMDLPKEFPSDIDYNYYIAKATEMLYDLNYLKRPEQVKFF